MKSIKGLSFYNSEGSLIDVEELYAQVQQLKQDSAAKIIIGETTSTTSTTSSDIDELAGTETDISLTNADDFKAGDMGISIVTVTDRNNSHGFMVFLALADEPDQPAGTLHVRFITGTYNGKDGIDGQGATIAVGEVTTGAAGGQASVTNSGTASAAVFDFTIPKGADGASGVTDVTAGTPTEQDGYTITPVTFNFEQGDSKTVNIQVKNGEGAGVQQNDVINRTASVTTADENSSDFVENNGDLRVKRFIGYVTEANTLEETLPEIRADTSAATAPNGKIYVFGGHRGGSGGAKYSDDIVEFDPVAQTAKTLSVTLPSIRAQTSAATAPNGKIYVFGGYVSSGTLNDIVEFDPVTKTATTLEATMPGLRAQTSAATAPNGKIYVFGGHSGLTSYYDDIVEFDPVAKSVKRLEATLPNNKSLTSAATAPNGKIYVFGGNGAYPNGIIEFDPVAQTATRLSVTLPSSRYGTSAATAPNGKIYVFGGNDRLNDILEFDPVAKTVTTLEATLPSGRGGTSAATAPNGKIYVFGGNNDGTRLSDIVEFAPPVAQYAYSQAVVLSQEEYTQFKNILNGVFSVGISAPTAKISGTLSASNTTINGTLTATGKITAPSAAVNGELTADSAEISGTLSAGNTTVNGTLSASGAVTVDGTVTASRFNATP